MKLLRARNLYVSFVGISVITGHLLAGLEGQRDHQPLLEIMLISGFFSLIPILVIASVAAWREENSSMKWPLILLGVGVSGLLADSWPLPSVGVPEWILAGFLGVAIPSLYASVLWLAIMTARKLTKKG